jgi:hypothetical protein
MVVQSPMCIFSMAYVSSCLTNTTCSLWKLGNNLEYAHGNLHGAWKLKYDEDIPWYVCNVFNIMIPMG